LSSVVEIERFEVSSLHRIIAEALGYDYDRLLEKPSSMINDSKASEILEKIRDNVKRALEILVDTGNPEKTLKALPPLPRSLKERAKKTLEYALWAYKRLKETDELGSIIRALNGEYIEPGVAGDPVRNPEVLPAGRHGYAFDPRVIPTSTAYARGVKIAEETLRRYYEKYGRYPETVGIVLWGFETAGTHGETIAEILQLLGVRLVRRHGPWSCDLEVIPLEELGRPRIDVVVTICGIFRDMFPHLIAMIDRAVRLVASLDEPVEMNYVRKHVLTGTPLYRVFGPRPGTYATRVTDAVETSNWRSREDLVSLYIEDMGYAYVEGVEGIEAHEVFKKLLASVDMITQVKYTVEYDIIDLDHYYEFLGGLKASIETLRGREAYTVWIDTSGPVVEYRELREAIDYAVRTRILNPKYIWSMLRHGYDGARELAKRIQYLIGLAVTTGEVPEWVWGKIAETYLLDNEVRGEIERVNKWALEEITKRLNEASQREFWKQARPGFAIDMSTSTPRLVNTS